MNRFEIRRSRTVATLAAGGLLGAIALSSCSSGQVAQTAEQVPAVNGSATTIKNVLLRDVQIQAVQTSDFLEPGHTVNLVLVAINQSPDFADKLVGITTDIGTVTLSGDTGVTPAGVLLVGTADGQNREAVGAVEAAHNAKATVAVNKPITNGLTYKFTFDFEKAGSGSLQVPISAGLASRQSETQTPAAHH